MSRAIALGILLTAWTAVCLGQDRPIVGAIRWDAWTGGPITDQVARTLGPEKYHDRLPWFAKVIDARTVAIDGSPQDVMDREIGFAASAGLDYWAFVTYPEASPMSTALKQYLKSRRRKQIRFCLILHNTLKAKSEQWSRERDRAVGLLKQRSYQTVAGGRPLVYAFIGEGFPFDRFSEFLTAARKKRINPYCVYMGWNPTSDFQKVRHKGFDAVSAYAKGGNQPKFAGLAKSVEQEHWQNAARSKVPYVPFVTTGWDKRPRKDNPVSWEKGHSYHRQKVFPSRARPSEIAEHLHNALTFVRKHQELCQANAVIVYAWNEHDEGGWLAPTRGPDGKPDVSRLDAIRRILKSNEATQQGAPADGWRRR